MQKKIIACYLIAACGLYSMNDSQQPAVSLHSSKIAQNLSNPEYRKKLLIYSGLQFSRNMVVEKVRNDYPDVIKVNPYTSSVRLMGQKRTNKIFKGTCPNSQYPVAEYVAQGTCAMIHITYNLLKNTNETRNEEPNNVSCSWKEFAAYTLAQAGFQATSTMTYKAVDKATTGDGRVFAHATTQTALNATNKVVTDAHLKKPNGFYGIAADVLAMWIGGYMVNSIAARMEQKQ